MDEKTKKARRTRMFMDWYFQPMCWGTLILMGLNLFFRAPGIFIFLWPLAIFAIYKLNCSLIEKK